MLERVRNYALEQMEETLTDSERAVAKTAADAALYGLMMLIDGVPMPLKRDDLKVELGFTVRLVRGGVVEDELDLFKDGDGMCMGYHYWIADDYGEDPVVEPDSPAAPADGA